jgi:hypothetical protein
MKGKNKIEVNPLEKSVREAVDQTDNAQNKQKQQSTQQIQQQQVQTRNQTMLQQKQQALQQKLQQIAKQKLSLEKQGKLAVPTYTESYDDGDETFRQHSRETFSNHKPSENKTRTSRVLQKIKELNKDTEKPKKKKKKMKEEYIEEKSPTWQTNAGKDLKKGGLNKKGIASYRREHPGSHLSMAVTTPPSKLDPDSKSAKRRKSFCARMSGNPGPMKDEKGRPTRKALSLRKWNC